MKNHQNAFISAQAVENLFAPPNQAKLDRLVRMRVIGYDGHVECIGIDDMCVTLGANLYDNLCEAGVDIEAFYENLSLLYYGEEIVGAYLYLCTQYSMLGEPVPEQIMLLPMHYDALDTFIEALITYIEENLIEDGIIDSSDGFAENESNKTDSGKVIHCVITFVTTDSGRV